MIESLRNEYGYYRLYDKYNISYYQNKYRCFTTPSVDNEYLCFLKPENGVYIEDTEFGAIKKENYQIRREKEQEVSRLNNISLYLKIQSITNLIRSKLYLNVDLEDAFILGTLNDRQIEEMLDTQASFREYGKLKQFYSSIVSADREKSVGEQSEPTDLKRTATNFLNKNDNTLVATYNLTPISRTDSETKLRRVEGKQEIQNEKEELVLTPKENIVELDESQALARNENSTTQEQEESLISKISEAAFNKIESNIELSRKSIADAKIDNDLLASRYETATLDKEKNNMVNRNNLTTLKEEFNAGTFKVHSSTVQKGDDEVRVDKSMILETKISKDNEANQCYKPANKIIHTTKECRFDRPIANKELVEDDKRSSIIVYEKIGKPILKDDSEYVKMGKSPHRLVDGKSVESKLQSKKYKEVNIDIDEQVIKVPKRDALIDKDVGLINSTTRKNKNDDTRNAIVGLKKTFKDTLEDGVEKLAIKTPKDIALNNSEDFLDYKKPEKVNHLDQDDELALKDSSSKKIGNLGDEKVQTGLVDTKDRKAHVDDSETCLEKEVSKFIHSENESEESKHLNKTTSRSPHEEEESFINSKGKKDIHDEEPGAVDFLDKGCKGFAVDKDSQETGVKNETSREIDSDVEICLRKQIKKVLNVKESEVEPTPRDVHIEEETRLNMFSRLWFLREIEPYDLLEISCLNVYPLQAEWLPRKDDREYKYIYRKACRRKFATGSSVKVRILLDNLTLVYEKQFHILKTKVKYNDDLVSIEITEDEIFIGAKKEIGYIVLHHAPDDKGGVVDVVAQPDLYLTQEHPFKDLGSEIGHLEMNVSIPIMTDFINICLFVWARFFIPFSGMTATQALKRYVGTISNWLGLEGSQAKMNIAHYERCLAWLIWNAEMVYHKHKVDLNLSGNLAIEELIAELIYYMEIHHFDVVPLWESIAKMDEQRNIFEDADFEMPIILDKIKGLRHKLNKYN